MILPIEIPELSNLTTMFMPVVGLVGMAGALALGAGAGIASGLIGRATSKRGGPVQLPGLIPRSEGAGYLRQAIGAAGQPTGFDPQIQKILNPPTSPFAAPLQQAILNPSFAPQTGAQQAIINQILAQRQGQFNALGIGSAPGTQAAVAAAAAPALAQFQQQHIGNLLSGQKIGLQGRELDANIVFRVLANKLAERNININTLLAGAELGQPVTAQQPGRAGFDVLGSAGGGAALGGALQRTFSTPKQTVPFII